MDTEGLLQLATLISVGAAVVVGLFRWLTLIAQLHYFSHPGFLPRHVWQTHQHQFARIRRNPAFCRYVEAAHGDETPRASAR